MFNLLLKIDPNNYFENIPPHKLLLLYFQNNKVALKNKNLILSSTVFHVRRTFEKKTFFHLSSFFLLQKSHYPPASELSSSKMLLRLSKLTKGTFLTNLSGVVQIFFDTLSHSSCVNQSRLLCSFFFFCLFLSSSFSFEESLFVFSFDYFVARFVDVCLVFNDVVIIDFVIFNVSCSKQSPQSHQTGQHTQTYNELLGRGV